MPAREGLVPSHGGLFRLKEIPGRLRWRWAERDSVQSQLKRKGRLLGREHQNSERQARQKETGFRLSKEGSAFGKKLDTRSNTP